MLYKLTLRTAEQLIANALVIRFPYLGWCMFAEYTESGLVREKLYPQSNQANN